MQAKPQDRLQQLEHTIARLKRRAEQLERVSKKYWTVRRIIFICGGLLALGFCKYSGGTAGLILVGLFLAIFSTVAIFHRRVRDSLTRNALLLNIQEIQIARIHLDWDVLPSTDQSRDSTSEAGHPF